MIFKTLVKVFADFPNQGILFVMRSNLRGSQQNFSLEKSGDKLEKEFLNKNKGLLRYTTKIQGKYVRNDFLKLSVTYWFCD